MGWPEQPLSSAGPPRLPQTPEPGAGRAASPPSTALHSVLINTDSTAQQLKIQGEGTENGHKTFTVK